MAVRRTARSGACDLIHGSPYSCPEATLHALADEILKYRRAVRLLAKAIGWADVGAPFALIAPGPYWRPRRTLPDVAPPVA